MTNPTQNQINEINNVLNRRLRARAIKGGLKLWLDEACQLIRKIDGTEFAGSARCDGYICHKLETLIKIK